MNRNARPLNEFIESEHLLIESTPSAVSYGYNQDGAAGRAGKKRPSLEQLVMSEPTPTAQDSRASGAAGYSTASGRHSGTTLTDAVCGAASAGRNGRLNPLYVEWSMGWPQGWISCECSVTELSLWLERWRFYISRKLSEDW